MSYEYQRPNEVRAAKEFFPFEVGVHKAEIKNVTLNESSKGFPMELSVMAIPAASTI